jgi:hypothetical protein
MSSHIVGIQSASDGFTPASRSIENSQAIKAIQTIVPIS